MRDATPDILVLVGLGLLIAGGWWAHPAVGLGLSGIALAAIGIGIARGKHDR